MSIIKREIHFAKLQPLSKRSYFTSQQARHLGVSSALLAYYSNIGLLTRVERGVYQSHSVSAKTSLQWGDLIQAIQVIPQGVICLATALTIYGYSEEKNRQYWIAIPHSTSAKASRLIKIARMRNAELGKTMISLDGVKVPIFDRERTIIDAFRQLGREAAIKALKIAITQKGAAKIDLVKLQTYAKKLRVAIEPYLLAVGT